MHNLVKTYNLSKRYGKTYQVKNINLSVEEGEIFGFLGPNGAGKTTTLKMLLGLVKPTKGKVIIFGKELKENRQTILIQIGSLIESPSYYGHLTGMENLKLVQRLRNIPEKNIHEVLNIVRLENQKDKKVNQYSLGMKQRLGIAMALLPFPKLLILDEPTNGLDPAGIEEIRELIKSFPSRFGITVLLSSHLLSEIEQIATSVGIINNGELLFHGSMESLKKKSQQIIKIRTSNSSFAHKILLSRGMQPILENDDLLFENISDAEVIQANRTLITSGIDVLRIEEEKKSLERIFLEMTGKGQSL
ncbi:ABC transporter ATP-binding protein [Ureibacillus thermosphaericus]|uniref:ABC transporter ATP-binding protein n=1 Tax=Ureibacillus thermosphaericus TaxID=51173 RepID=UPI0002DA5189|nr:ABC transporter ATP-binding protein [Ureibacillus thermosphaericus]